MYGCEAWTLYYRNKNLKLKTAEILYRRLLRVSWTDKWTNESILQDLSIKRQLLHEIDDRRLRYFGHANRSTATSLMSTVVMGKVKGKRRRGRWMSYISKVVNASGLKMPEMLHKSRDRRRWHDLMIARGVQNVCTG